LIKFAATVFGLVLFCALYGVAAQAQVVLSADEVKRVLSHGPWPLPPISDSGNEYSVGDKSNTQAVSFGKKLFFDKRLSSDKSVACASCHDPKKAFTDGLSVSNTRIKTQPLARNSPSLLNAAQERWYGWDGASDSIWSQSLRPLFDPREMGFTQKRLQTIVLQDDEFRRAYRSLFADPKIASEEAISVNVAKAIGAYVATLKSGKSQFDIFRDSLAAGNIKKATNYPIDAQLGMQIFIGKGQCNTCHVGPMFSNGEFADIGIPFFVRSGGVDAGRHSGIELLKQSRYNLLSIFSSADEKSQQKTRYVDAQHRNFGEFKVPSLRNVSKTAPYMHNGSVATLEAVVNHYSELNLDRLHADGDQILKPLKLTAQEKKQLVAFLKSL
jgi:cytochrome c peroxidase